MENDFENKINILENRNKQTFLREIFSHIVKEKFTFGRLFRRKKGYLKK